jgi:hypothetical protein
VRPPGGAQSAGRPQPTAWLLKAPAADLNQLRCARAVSIFPLQLSVKSPLPATAAIPSAIGCSSSTAAVVANVDAER